MAKTTSLTHTAGTASANGNAAVSSADTAQAAQSAQTAETARAQQLTRPAETAQAAQTVQSAGSAAAPPDLRSVFPQYKSIVEIQREIAADPQMTAVFQSWPPARQQEFLDFCCGSRGVRILYDAYFKYVFDPAARPAELSRMVSALIGLDVNIVQVLPNESRLGADYTLVIMDIIVETDDGSIINVEIQKIGYNFPGERAACYNADLLLRQYQRIRKEFAEFSDYSSFSPEDDAAGDVAGNPADNIAASNGNHAINYDHHAFSNDIHAANHDHHAVNHDNPAINHDNPAINHAVESRNGKEKKERKKRKEQFSYRLMRPVYTIVFMEKSTKSFHEFPADYIHAFTPVSSTGLKLNLLQNYVFVPLDIFKQHLAGLLNSAGGQTFTEQEAWLAFLSSDDPQVIRKLLEQYPGIFRPLFDRICTMCRNTKEMMHMFSEELSIMDKNTVMLMIEEQQETIEGQKKTIEGQKETIEGQKETIEGQKETIDQLEKDKSQMHQELTYTIANAQTERVRFEAEIEVLRRELEEARMGKAGS